MDLNQLTSNLILYMDLEEILKQNLDKKINDQEFVETLINHDKFKPEMIDVLLGEFYLANINNLKETYTKNYIEKNVNNKDLMYKHFYHSNNFAIKLIENYLIEPNNRKLNYVFVNQKNKNEIVNLLFNGNVFLNVDTIDSLARKLIANIHNLYKKTVVQKYIFEVKNLPEYIKIKIIIYGFLNDLDKEGITDLSKIIMNNPNKDYLIEKLTNDVKFFIDMTNNAYEWIINNKYLYNHELLNQKEVITKLKKIDSTILLDGLEEKIKIKRLK